MARRAGWTCQTNVRAASWVRLGARFGLANERAAIGLLSLISGSGLSGASPHQIGPHQITLRPRLDQRLLLVDQLLPVLAVFWFVPVILEIGHFAAQAD